eukprot:scaffold23690_cov67-Attheya_sp.AAC.1
MVPYVDFFNHRNGHWDNADGELYASLDQDEFEIAWFSSTASFDDTFKVQATRTIQPGEQIYISVNSQPVDGVEMLESDGYGTPDMLRDLGFVEDLPQRWTTTTTKMHSIYTKTPSFMIGLVDASWMKVSFILYPFVHMSMKTKKSQ